MDTKETYEERIARELRALPQTALAEVLRLIATVRQKYLGRAASTSGPTQNGRTTHERTRALLATAKGNWAQDLIRDREDRL